VTFSGGTSIEMPNCDVFSNSSATNAAVGKGSSSVIANSVGAVGGVQQSNNFTVNAYKPYSAQLPDPFSGVTPDPSNMNCTSQAFSVALLSTYNCFSSLSVQPNSTVTVPSTYSGPIYINGGNVQFKGNFTCGSCTIVLTNSSTSSTATIGTLSANATANINITAPTSGTYKGIAIYQDRRAAICTGNCNNVNGNSSSIITGAIYTPRQEVYYNGTGTVSATCTMFVSYRVTFNGTSALSNKFQSLSACASAGLPGASASKVVRLVA
jgi:hypothetical protein